MNRKTFLKTSGLLLAGSFVGGERASAVGKGLPDGKPDEDSHAQTSLRLADLHVHRSEKQSIEDIVNKSKQTGVRFGVVENIAPWGIKTDEELKAYIDAVKPYPVYVGLQPMQPGWSKNLSKELIAQADYILMDPQVVPRGNGYGETVYVWEYATYIDNPDAFMERNMAHYMDILTGDEPLDVFACPFFLPASVEREYHRLWTAERLQKVIDAALARNIAIEINDLMRVPHEEFVVAAKRAGIKFTFGSDTRDQKTGRLDYCKYIASKCGLTQGDFFVPKRNLE